MTRITFFLPLLLLFLFFQDKQGGQIGLVVDCEWAEANSEKIEDKSAAARRLDFQLGWYFCLCLMFLFSSDYKLNIFDAHNHIYIVGEKKSLSLDCFSLA